MFAGIEFVLLLLIRKPPLKSAKEPWAYFVAFWGTFAITLYQPSLIPNHHLIIGDILIYCAVILEIIGFFSLNRSAGIVAANRGIKIGGLYKFVRHPIYLSYTLLCLGYFLSNMTFYNLFIMALIVVFQVLRIREEEKILIEDPKYVAYKKTVKWKLFPWVY